MSSAGHGFMFATPDEERPADNVAIDFKDDTVVLPAWVLDAIAYYDMEEHEEEEFRGFCAKIKYERFLARCRVEAGKIEQNEFRENLNNIQRAIIARFRSNNRLYGSRLVPRIFKRL